MTGHFHTVDKSSEPERTVAARQSFELSSVVVQYEGKPNRCTIYPTEASRLDRMASWISADADLFVPLDESR